MFLISKFVYDAMGKSKFHAESIYLKIHNHSPEHHKQTFYKFRYGAPDVKGEVGKPTPLKLKRGSSAAIWSLEGFELSERVLGLFGHSSDLFRRGLDLIHSPFIDPTFRGRLQLIIRNFSDQEITLLPEEIIGKIIFFDISDTILSAEDLLAEVQNNAQNQVREKAIQELSQALGNISKS
jgi:deoxycytidine triphosphate deaminase